MSKIYHERPALKYVDNIRREIKKLSALLSNDSNNRCPVESNSSIDKYTWNKMLKINLTDIELKKISELFDLSHKLFEFQINKLKLLEIEFKIHEQLPEQKKALKNN
jgi:hypothetical protein